MNLGLVHEHSSGAASRDAPLTTGAVSQSGREMLKSFQATRLLGVSSSQLFI